MAITKRNVARMFMRQRYSVQHLADRLRVSELYIEDCIRAFGREQSKPTKRLGAKRKGVAK